MTAITADMIKQLRERTGAGMLDCRKALTENDGEIENAIDWLRKKGLSAAAKKSGRVAAEGLVAVAVEGTKGAIIELNAETDFVGRNDKFQKLASGIAEFALHNNMDDVEALKSAKCPKTGQTIEEQISNAIATIGENMTLRRASILSVKKGIVASYVHNAVAQNMGKIAVLVAIETEGDAAQAEALGKQIAMHIAATNPESLSTDDLDDSKIERERVLFREQAAASGKPPEVVEKMIEGRLRKFYEEVVLLEQVFVVDGKAKVKEVIANAEKAIGKPVKLTSFISYRLGEGIEKQESDFAAEVAAAAGAA